MAASVSPPPEELLASLEAAAERYRLAKIALRRHQEETSRAAQAAQVEEQRIRVAIATTAAEIDVLLEELAR